MRKTVLQSAIRNRLRSLLVLRSLTSLPSKSFDLEVVVGAFEAYNRSKVLASSSTQNENVFRIALPPPNVTGNLHLGHALTATIEDALCRYSQLFGSKVTWYPGFDHAGIATQAIVEKHLWMTKKIRRHQISREEFITFCMDWKDRRIEDIKKQFGKLGTMLDFEDAYFTMDERFSRAVSHAFVKLHSNGLIFRDRRIVNWCPTLQSTISDQEVDLVELAGVDEITIPSDEFGSRKLKVGMMHRISYELLNRKGCVEVATTRPETVFADVALAVNPKDDRYSHLIGKMVRHPLINSRFLPILEDDAVDPEKGTGVLKITPSHDFLDFEIAKRHLGELVGNVFTLSCLDEKGRLKSAGELDGLDRFDAREKVIEQLINVNAYGGFMKHSDGVIGICSRTGDVIEPMICLKPAFLISQLKEWLQNYRPWCLSRQLVWGHRIPAYYSSEANDWIIAENIVEAQKKCSGDLIQDGDVLDTWFSSSLVPLIIAGWPEKKIEANFLTLMETGYDILGFWVARMLTVCEELTGHYPFHDVLLHGLIRDSRGRKMSKSLGNVIDPNDVIDGIGIEDMVKRIDESPFSTLEKTMAKVDMRNEFPTGIQKYGADALRFAMLRHNVTGLDIKMDVLRSADEGYRFCNKLWNLTNYATMVFSAVPHHLGDIHVQRTVADQWILSRLATTLLQFDSHFENFCLNHAATALQNLFQSDLCDFYLETTKKALRDDDKDRIAAVSQTLRIVLENSFAALSVVMPFVSQYLFNVLKVDATPSLEDFVIDKGKLTALISPELEKAMDVGIAVVSTLRSIRAQLKLPTETHLKVFFFSRDTDLSEVIDTIGQVSNATLFHGNVHLVDARHYLPFSVQGYPVALHVKVEGNSVEIVRGKLLRQLQKAEEKKRKADERIQKFQDIASDVKPSVVVKQLQRLQKAKGVAKSSGEEIEKLKGLLSYFEETAPQSDS